jgi:hypothetical protein
MNSSIGEFGPLIFMLIGPDQEIRSLSPQVVETTLGRIECAGRSGRRLMIFDQREVDVTYRQWVHESAPFGVLRSEMKSSIKFDGQTMQAKTSITQVDVGTGARSRILTGNQSVEELTVKPFAPAGSWQWAIVPARFNWSSMGNRGLAMTINKEDEQVRFMLAYQASKDAMYRPVAFDADQRRYEFQSRNSVASGTVGLAAFTLAQDVLPTGEIKYIGVEKSSQEIRKEPPSLVGKSLPDFSNIGFNFVPKRADEKAILICFFDINQRPSRNCIMQLTKEAQELKAKDIVVIAVQASMIDENKLNEWIKKCNIPFPVGMIEGDEEKIRFIWGVRSLPWLILTDKKHIVQAEGFSINELDERIATLIDNNTAALSYQYQFLLFLEELIDFSECKLRLLL